jgi:diguanylate cyclase (GGDEF)-like protein
MIAVRIFSDSVYTVAHILSMAGIGLAAIFLACVHTRDRRHMCREQGLQNAVRQRTDELEIERIREKERNGILELIVSNEPLDPVLDRLARLLENESGASHCLILLKDSDHCRFPSASGFPPDWLTALASPRSVPFEVWKYPREFVAPQLDPAWAIFAACLNGPPPAAIRTHPVGAPHAPLGAILLFEKAEISNVRPEISNARARQETAGLLESTARLAQVAIEHHRFCGDLQYQAHHDTLTGLANRALFEDRLTAAIVEARRHTLPLALLFIDLDRFKEVNDTVSHRAGDAYLTEIAQRLRQAVGTGDTVARIGGDEFNVLVTNIRGEPEAQQVADRILAAICRPMIVDGHSLAGTASVGFAMFPGDGIEAEDLRREADAAMYCAKNLGGNRVLSFSARNRTLDCVRMNRELHVALRDRMFTVHYQPKIAADGHFGGLEALLRLNHPEHGSIPPNDFIPVAEASGFIVPLGAWVLDEVCRQMAEWRARGLGQICVAVNVSAVQISRPDFAEVVQDCLVRHGISPWSIELELTERLLIGGGPEPQRQMQQLRALGIRFSIDDFGTGYSSLSCLHRLNVDAIKLDRSFVQSIDTDPAARRLVQAMIDVAESLGLNVIAEGVETEAQRTALIAAGCRMMQGFLFARPQPAADLEDYLRGATSDLDDLLRIGCMVENSSASAAMLLTM